VGREDLKKVDAGAVQTAIFIASVASLLTLQFVNLYVRPDRRGGPCLPRNLALTTLEQVCLYLL